MYIIGEEEIDAVARVIRSGKLFRYDDTSECSVFERRYGEFLGAAHVGLTSSGTSALTAALVGVGIGPGDEVIVPAHTYMATAVSVLAVGAIPVIVDIDESICLDPQAVERAIGPQTRAVIPVHMWGQICDMDAIMKVADAHNLIVVEDACQAVGGAYGKRMAASIGHAGAFSFNYFKNISCGEGGAVVTSDRAVYQRAICAIDCCRYFWNDRETDAPHFTYSGSRASEIEGAILNAQLDRLPGMIASMREQKQRILRETADLGLGAVPRHSPEGECATATMFALPTAEQARDFAERVSGTILLKTGRHTYHEWTPILEHRGGPHPATNPYEMPQNAACRKEYSRDMCPRSLEILSRTVSIGNNPKRTDEDVTKLVGRIREAAAAVLETTSAE